ncbi:MAG: WD40 repeat domain-containing protein, partial [Gemmataceae bacterium]
HHNCRAYRLALSPDGKRLLASFLSNSGDRGLYCWDIAAGRQAWLNEDVFGIQSMVFTADGKILTSPWGQTVDLATGRTIELENPPPIQAKGGVVYLDRQLSLTPDGRTLLIPRPEGVIVWDMVHGKQLRMLEGAGEDIVVMPDGKSIITNNGFLQRWDLATGKPLWSDTFALGHIGEVVSLAFSADGKRLASAATDGTVRLWDATTGKPLRLWRGHMAQRPITTSAWMAAAVKTVDITADGRQVLSADSGEHIKLWDAATVKEARSLTLPPRENGEADREIFHARINSNGSKAIALFGPTAGHTSKLATWDLKTGERLTCHRIESVQPQSSILAPDGRALLSDGVLVDA